MLMYENELQGTNSPGSGQAPVTSGDWIIPATEITKYDQIFEGLHPVNGLLAGDKVRPVSVVSLYNTTSN